MVHCVHWLFGTLLILHAYTLSVFAYENNNAYCNYNQTNMVAVPVNKTRLVERKPTGFFKFTKKTKLVQEVYETVELLEEQKLVIDCCAGYRMTAEKTCRPYCEQGCPRHAHCVLPNRCRCQVGYKFTTEHECVPECNAGCMAGSECVAPDVCKCKMGYRAEAGKCVPMCAAGEGCRNGQCIEGYQRNEQTGACELTTDCENAGVSCGVTDVTESSTEWDAQSTHSDWNADIDSGSGGGNDSGSGDSSGSGSGDDALFASECDCTMQFGVCTQDGRCACAEGYVMQQPEAVGDIEAAPICAALLAASAQASDSRWLLSALICMGVLVVLLGVAVVVVKIWRQRRGSMDVAGKTELCCKYDKRDSNSTDIMRA